MSKILSPLIIIILTVTSFTYSIPIKGIPSYPTNDLSRLTNDVSSVWSYAVGSLTLLDDASICFAAGDKDALPYPSIIAAEKNIGEGHVIALSHDSFFHNDVINKFDNIQFGLNIITYLDQLNINKILITSGHQECLNSINLNTFTNWLKLAGYSVTASSNKISANLLKDISVVIIGNAAGDFDDSEINELLTYLNNGGGLLLLGNGWAWEPYHPGKTIEQYPMNVIGSHVGFYWGYSVVNDPTNNYEDYPVITRFYPQIYPNINIENYKVEDKSITVTGNVTTANTYNEIIMIKWEWGDDTKDTQFLDATHNYQEYGVYNLTMTAYQDDFFSTTKTMEVQIGVRSKWDKIIIETDALQRISLNSQNVKYKAYYNYDKTPFLGKINHNDTLGKNSVGKYGYKVTNIIDDIYGITSFTSNEFIIIYDGVQVELSIDRSRLDISDEPNIQILSFYKYDSTQFNGQVTVNQPSTKQVGPFNYSTQSISDPHYNISVYSSNQLTLIFDRILITESGSSSSSTEINKPVTLWFKAIYESDESIFDDLKGILYVNEIPFTWSTTNQRWEKQITQNEAKIVNFKVTRIEENEFNLKTINDVTQPLSVEWTAPPGIPSFSLEASILGIIIITFIFFKKNLRRNGTHQSLFQ